VCAYAALIPFQPVLTMPDGSPLRFAAADAVAPLVLLAAVVVPKRRLPSGLLLTVIGIPLVALLSTLVAAHERALTWYAMGKTAGLFYLAALAVAAARSVPREAGPVVLRSLAFGALWSAVLGLAGYAAWMAGFPTSLVSTGRLCSTMPGDPNIYCSLLAVGLIVMATDVRWSLAVRAASVAVLSMALVLTGSRSGVVGAGVGLAITLLVRSRDPWVTGARAAYVLIAVGIVGTVALLSAPGEIAGDFIYEHASRAWTVDNRFALYTRALEQFSEHPFLGLGIGGFNELNTWSIEGAGGHMPVHNTYLWALVDLGLAGGILMTGVVVVAIVRCARAAAHRPGPEGAAQIAGALAAMAGFNLFVDGFYQRHLWVLIACAMTLPAARRVRRVPVVSWRHEPAAMPVTR
jgi:O-antigen ligase